MARGLRQRTGRQPTECEGNGRVCIECVDHALLVTGEATLQAERQIVVEIGIVGVGAQARREAGRRIGCRQRAERAADAFCRAENGVAGDNACARERGTHAGTAERRGATDLQRTGGRRRHVELQAGVGRQGQVAIDREGAGPGQRSRQQGAAAVHGHVAHRASAAERAAGVHRRGRYDRSVDEQHTAIDDGRARVGVRTVQGQQAGPALGQSARAADVVVPGVGRVVAALARVHGDRDLAVESTVAIESGVKIELAPSIIGIAAEQRIAGRQARSGQNFDALRVRQVGETG